MIIPSQLTWADLGDTYDGPHATPQRVTSGPYFLNISSLSDGRLDLAQSDHVSSEDFAKWTRRVTPQADDLLFSYETRLGEAALMPDGINACLGRRMALLRPNPDLVHPRFMLYYYLSPAFQQIIEQNTIYGATVNRISLSTIGKWPVTIPSLKEQQAVAEVLGALDDKIAANIKLANSAYNLAQARWSSVVLNSQSRVEWNTIGSLGTVVTGKTPPTSNSDNYNGETPFVTISDMRSGIHILHSERTLSSAGVSTVQNSLLPTGAILMSCIATVGEVAITTQPSVTNQQINALVPEGKYDPMFIYLGFRHVGRELESRGSGGSVYTNVSKSAFSSIRIPILPYSQQKQVIAEMDEVEKAMRIQNMTLARTRDELLPRLMSGKLSVKEAEAVASEAT